MVYLIEKMKNKKKQGTLYFILMLLMVITGTFNTVFLKLQNSAFKEILGKPFLHPWFQSILMFLGEFYCAIMWIVYKKWFLKEGDDNHKSERKESINNDKKEDLIVKKEENVKTDNHDSNEHHDNIVVKKKPHYESMIERKSVYEDADNLPEVKPWYFLIPCGCDLIGSTLLNFALLNMAGSVFQMLRGGIIIITAIMCIIFLKTYPKNFQWLGVGTVFIGIFLVGLATQLDTTETTETTNFLGIILLIISLLFQGFQFIYEESTLSKYKCHALQVIAWEGTWGFLAFIILLPIFEFIPCNFSGKETFCSVNEKGEYYLEQTIFAFRQMAAQWQLFLYCIFQTFSICFFNLFGIMIVEYSSSTTRSVMDSTRTVLVWIFFLIVPMADGKLLEHFLVLELIGFLILLFGQLVFNGIIVIPLFGFDKHFKNKDNEEENLLVEDDQNEKSEEDSLKTITPDEKV